MAGRCLAIFLLLAGFAGCGHAANAQFQDARALVTQGRYQEAVPALEAYLKAQPNGKDASRAGLFLFKSQAALGDLVEARKWCDWTVVQHPKSLEAHKCRYKMAMIALWEGRRGVALEEFEAISQQPSGPLAAEATAMVRFLKASRIEMLEPIHAGPGN